MAYYRVLGDDSARVGKGHGAAAWRQTLRCEFFDMTKSTLSLALQAVVDEPSFLRFVGLLAEDRAMSEATTLSRDGHQGEWANQTIQDFLLAAKSWAEDSDFGARPGPKPESQWARMAMFLWAGRGYE